ncbi:hypothetical protein AALO_G00288210 [Alosa alosa]|uniref:Uncharacterized protein n=1 Tax=Alosa alosa TaxID=278164 RepID=A0AAV6FGF9_9TELE|nr:hypothetical protein AALO_G00288210 [Alosa alosa]
MDGATKGPLVRLMGLDESEWIPSEWIESWKSTKGFKNGDGPFKEKMVQNIENKQYNIEISKSMLGESWKYLNCQFHSVSNSILSCLWADAWKISKPMEYHDEASETKDDVIDYKPLDPYVHGVIIPVCKAEKYKFWSNQFHEGNTTLAEWKKSCEVVKNSSILKNVTPTKKVESKENEKESEEINVEESEPDGLPKRLKPKDKLKNRQKLLNPLSQCDFPFEWNDAWKFPKSQPKEDHWETSNSEWMETWRVATLQRHHNRLALKSNSHLFAPLLNADEVPPWCRTWKFINLLPRQYKPFWDKDHENFEVEIWPPPVTEYVPPSNSAEEEEPDQSVSWRICGPQPLEWDDTPKVFVNRKDEVLWSRRSCNNGLYSCLNLEILSQTLWARSWRFRNLESTSSSLTMPKTDTTKSHLFSEMEKTKPFAPTWSKSAKLATSQPQAKSGPTSGVKGIVEAENMSFKLVDSWMLSNDLSSQMGKVSWAEWVNSWRFLLPSYSPQKKDLSSQEVEMAERPEVTVYDNKELRNQWEIRANEFSKRDQEERSRMEKSALNGLFQEWNYRLAVRTGLPTSGEKKGKVMSDFRKYVVTAPTVEQDEKALQAKFKVVIPPRKPAPPPPPPPAPKKREPRPPPPARKERPKPDERKPARAPQPARKPSAPTPEKAPSQPAKPMAAPAAIPAAYKDNLSQAGWNESWKMLKPLINMERVLGTGRDASDLNVHKYRPVQHSLDEMLPPSSEWNKSYTSLKNDMHKNDRKEQKPWRSFQEPENLSGSEWEQSWKMQNFEFQQQVEAWGLEWSGFCRQPRDRISDNTQQRGDAPQGWEESWKSFKPQPKQEGEHLESEDYWSKEFLDLYKHGVFCPGWNDSWKVPEVQTHMNALEEVYLKDWAESWRCSRHHSWCKESSHLRHRLHALLMSKRMMCNKRKTSQLQEETAAEWAESWMCLKGQTQEKEEDESTSAEVDVSHVPLHLQFHMLNTKIPGWDKSWSVAKTPSPGDEKQGKPQWRNSWKISNSNPVGSSKTQQQDIVCWSSEHRSFRYTESETDYITPGEWSASWQTMKPPAESETKPQQELAEVQNGHPIHALLFMHLLKIPLLDWNDSWKFSNKQASSNTLSLSRWSESWRFSNPNHPEEENYRQKGNGRRHQNGPFKVDPQFTEWGESWKYLKSDSLKPDMPREDSGEWGESWRVLNPQLYLKKEAWSEQESAGEFDDLRLQLSFLLKEDKKVFSPEFSMPEWNESWKFLKLEGEHDRK